MSRDSVRSHVHLRAARTVTFFDEWNKSKLDLSDLQVHPDHEPPNPDDDDGEAVPEHMPFTARSRKREPAWSDMEPEALWRASTTDRTVADPSLTLPLPRPDVHTLDNPGTSLR